MNFAEGMSAVSYVWLCTCMLHRLHVNTSLWHDVVHDGQETGEYMLNETSSCAGFAKLITVYS